MTARLPPLRRKPEVPAAAEALLADPELAQRGLVAVGLVGRPHGLGGSFFVSGRSSLIPLQYKMLLVGASVDAAQSMRIVESRMQGARPTLRLEGVVGREAAQTLTGQHLWAKLDSIPRSSEGWLWSELLAVRVVDATGLELGTISKVYNAGASDIIEVRGPLGTVDIPMVAAYVDFAVRDSGILRLVVDGAVFIDLWEDGTPARPAKDE